MFLPWVNYGLWALRCKDVYTFVSDGDGDGDGVGDRN